MEQLRRSRSVAWLTTDCWLPTVWALGTTAQAARRLTPEWCSMSRDERKEEILAYVEAAGKTDFVKDPTAEQRRLRSCF